MSKHATSTSEAQAVGTSRRQEVSVDEEEGRTFNERQRSHYVKLLLEKWECSVEGHVVCVPTEDGQHFRLGDDNIEQWVNALCSNRATTADPPHSMFEIINGGAVWNRNNGELTVRAVSIAPSRRRPGPHHHPVGSSARSIDSTVAVSNGGNTTSFLESLTSDGVATSISSGVPGPGYFGGKAIKWLGEKGLDAIKFAVIKRRASSHVSCLEKWEKRRPALGVEERGKVFEMLGDALEMSRTCYSTNVNKTGYYIGRAVLHWLQVYHDIPQTPEIQFWHIQVQISLIPILLTRVAHEDPLAADLAHRTLSALTRVPLSVQRTETAAEVIWLVARELAYAQCKYQHSWLGVWLLRIVEMSLRLRALSHAEIQAIRELAARRVEQHTQYDGKGKDVWRPWEVALFAQCASQDTWLKDAVIDAHGLPSLIAALDFMLADHVRVRDVHWENVALTLRSLAFLSEQEWIAHAIEPVIVKSLLRVFRRSIPERWFCIRFWAADTIRNMVANRPELARTLLQENAVSAFETLTNPQIDHELSADPSELDRQRHQVRSIPPLPPTPPLPTLPAISPSSPLFQSPRPSHSLLPPLSPTDERRPSSSSSTSSNPPATPSSAAGEQRFPQSSTTPHRTPPHLAEGTQDRRASTSSSRRDTIRQLSVGLTPRRPPSHIPTLTQERLLEAYKVEATKRAAELSEYLKKWTDWTPDKLPMLEAPQLEVVGAGVGWLPEFAAVASDAEQ